MMQPTLRMGKEDEEKDMQLHTMNLIFITAVAVIHVYSVLVTNTEVNATTGVCYKRRSVYMYLHYCVIQ